MKTQGTTERNYFIRMYNYIDDKSVTISRFNSYFKVNEHEVKKESDFRELNEAIKYCMDQGYTFQVRSIYITGHE